MKNNPLTDEEKRIIKALLDQGRSGQDIQSYINFGRKKTINLARISELKKNCDITSASNEELNSFEAKKKSYDPKTGLNAIDDERLVRAREVMIMAVQVFNTPTLKYKSALFSMLANVAWTYLMHEYYDRKGLPIKNKDDKFFTLTQLFTTNGNCPLSDAMKLNLKHLKEIRDEVEHRQIRFADNKWIGLFQSCCLNFDKTICELFGDNTTIKHELPFTLHFAKLGFDQIGTLNDYDIPENIKALDIRLSKELTEKQLDDCEYKFKINFQAENVSKSKKNFTLTSDEKGARIVAIKAVALEKKYPYKPKDVVAKVKKFNENFNMHKHTAAWKEAKVRPLTNAEDRSVTDKNYCYYSETFNGYSYNDAWIDYLVAKQEKN